MTRRTLDEATAFGILGGFAGSGFLLWIDGSTGAALAGAIMGSILGVELYRRRLKR